MPGIFICRGRLVKLTASRITQLLLFIFICCTCFGQQFDSSQLIKQYNAVDESLRIKHSIIDSLQHRMLRADDTVKVDCLNELYVAELQLDNRIAFRFLEQAGELARKIGYVKGEGKYLEYLGNYHMEMKNVPEAESAFRKAAQLYSKNNLDAEYYQALQTLGLCLYWQLKFDEAYRLTRETYEYLKNIPGNARIAYVYRRMGLMLDIQGKYEEAFDYFIKDKKISDTIKDKKGSRKSYGIYINIYLGKLYHEAGDIKNAMHYFKVAADKAMDNIMPDVYDEQIGEIHFILGNLDSAEYYFSLRKNCAKRFLKDSALRSQVLTLFNVPLAKVYLSQSRFDTVIALLKPVLPFVEGLIFSSDVYKYLGLASLGANRLNDALIYSKKLMNIANIAGARPMLKDAAEIRWKTFERLKMPDSAYFYLKMFKDASDILSADKQLRNIEAMKWKAEGERQQAEINLLSKEKLLHLKQKQLLVVLLVSISVVAFFVSMNIQLKRKHERMEFEKRATELRMQALRAQMNPHFIFNALNSINNFILNNDSAVASRYLTKFSRLIRLMLHHSQSSLITLQDELDALKIYIEIEQLRFGNRFDYSIYIPYELDPSSYKVPPLIIQPFVENAIWHGLLRKKDKGLLAIEFFIQEKNVFCRIVDDGVGRNKTAEVKTAVETNHKSLGMEITAERIHKAEKNGTYVPINILDRMNADGTPGGTVVTVQLPEEII